MDFDSFFKAIGKARRIAWIFGILYILMCLAMGWELDKPNQQGWGIAAATGGIIAFAWIGYPYYCWIRDYFRTAREERELGHDMRTLGIQRVYSNGLPRKLLREELTKPGIKRIRILANSAKTYMILYSAEIWPELLAAPDLHISVLIAHEDTPFTVEAAKMESINMNRNDPISPSIREVKLFLEEKAKQSDRKNFIEIRQFSTQIRANLIIVDDSWCCFTPHLPPISPMNSFAFELASTEEPTKDKTARNGSSSSRGNVQPRPGAEGPGKNRSLLRACIDHFETVWNASR